MSAVTLFNSSFIGSSAGDAFTWIGGRCSLVLTADQYGGGVFLQSQGPSGKWVNVNGATFSADQVTGYDLPAGEVKLVSNQSSSINLCATLASVPYKRGR